MGVEDGPTKKVAAEPLVSTEETPSYPKGKILLREPAALLQLILYTENWVVEIIWTMVDVRRDFDEGG